MIKKFKANSLLKRVMTSCLFVPVMLCFTLVGGLPYAIFILSLSLVCMIELSNMTKKDRPLWRYYFYSSIFLVFFFFLNLIAIRNVSVSASLYLLFIVWTTDTSAYFCGILIGGRKLAPTLSPNKTLSGFIGALFFSGVLGAILYVSSFMQISNNLTESMLAAIFISCCSQAGDLAESALKRYFSVKDSGNLLPGHGGLLDRIDGLIFASFAMVSLVSA